MTTYSNLGTRLRRLIELLDNDVAKSYQALGLDSYKPRYTPVYRALMEHEAMTIGGISKFAGVSQPAMSQTIREMIRLKFVKKIGGQDARESKVELTQNGLRIVPRLTAQWEATTSAANDLDSELPTSLIEAVEAAIEALNKQSFRSRIVEKIQSNEN